jgi:L-alanine-DL-glutamate epimerase-like enolase superfamily enzyme
MRLQTSGSSVKSGRNKGRINANQSWSPKRAISSIRKLERFDIDFVEQPIPAPDFDGLAFVRKNSSIPIMADESVYSTSDVLRIVKLGAAGMVNIKLMKCGGIHEAVKIATICEAEGLPDMVGCMLEGAIGIAAGVHFALSTRNVVFVDLYSDRDIKNTLTSGKIPPFEGCYRRDDGYPGLGNFNLSDEEVELVKSITVNETYTSL